MRISPKHFAIQGPEVALPELLQAREARALLQQQLLQEYGSTLLCLTLTAVGGVKKNALLDYVFAEALAALQGLFQKLQLRPQKQVLRPLTTGHEAFFVLPIEANALKQAVIELEESLPLARLWDLDVFDAQGHLLSRSDFGLPARPCLVCGDEAKVCARSRKHDLASIIEEMQQRAQAHDFAKAISQKVQQALLQEATLAPKPGLVDSLNNGAHRDMDLQSFQASALALTPFFQRFVLLGMQTAALAPKAVLPKLRPLGIEAEQAMFAATNQVNTHKGAIFSFGLVCAAIGRLYAQGKNTLESNEICALVASFCDGLSAELQAYPAHLPLTAGVRLYRLYGLTGARGEAEQGLPQVQALLPQFAAWQKFTWEHGLLLALLQLLAHNPDTNVVHRGGLQGLEFMQQQAQQLLADKPTLDNFSALTQALNEFNHACVTRNLSPGGSADLLALTIFFLYLRGN